MVFNDNVMCDTVVYLGNMSEYSSPVSVAFEFQRNAIRGTCDIMENSVRAQQNLNEAVSDGFGPARNTTERGTDMFRTGLDAYFDAVESAVPAGSGFGELREMMHESLGTFEKSQLDAIEGFETNFDEGTDSAGEMLEEFLSALDDQVTTMLDAHENLEAQTVEALERLEDGIEELLTEVESRGEEMQNQFESQAEAVQEQLEEVTESMQETAESSDLSA